MAQRLYWWFWEHLRDGWYLPWWQWRSLGLSGTSLWHCCCNNDCGHSFIVFKVMTTLLPSIKLILVPQSSPLRYIDNSLHHPGFAFRRLTVRTSLSELWIGEVATVARYNHNFNIAFLENNWDHNMQQRVCKKQSNHFTLSFAQAGKPGVYTRVQYYDQWIREMMGDSGDVLLA